MPAKSKAQLKAAYGQGQGQVLGREDGRPHTTQDALKDDEEVMARCTKCGKKGKG